MSDNVELREGDSPQGGRMHQFQEHLADRLRKAETQPQAARLGLQIGDQRWLVSLSQAGQIVPIPSAITAVPLARDWLVGMVNLNGTLYTVSDLNRFLGGGPTQLAKESCLLAFSQSLDVNAALLVTRMLGLHDPGDWEQLDNPPNSSVGFTGNMLVDPDGRDWQELDLARLAADERFLAAGR